MMQVRPPPRSPLAPAPDWEPLCSEFDPEEERFLVNCSQSTFCMTRTHTLHIRNGEISSQVKRHHECTFDQLL